MSLCFRLNMVLIFYVWIDLCIISVMLCIDNIFNTNLDKHDINEINKIIQERILIIWKLKEKIPTWKILDVIFCCYLAGKILQLKLNKSLSDHNYFLRSLIKSYMIYEIFFFMEIKYISSYRNKLSLKFSFN